jgi:hypothetical protein
MHRFRVGRLAVAYRTFPDPLLFGPAIWPVHRLPTHPQFAGAAARPAYSQPQLAGATARRAYSQPQFAGAAAPPA